jgi:hypothetical protein
MKTYHDKDIDTDSNEVVGSIKDGNNGNETERLSFKAPISSSNYIEPL